MYNKCINIDSNPLAVLKYTKLQLYTVKALKENSMKVKPYREETSGGSF